MIPNRILIHKETKISSKLEFFEIAHFNLTIFITGLFIPIILILFSLLAPCMPYTVKSKKEFEKYCQLPPEEPLYSLFRGKHLKLLNFLIAFDRAQW